MCTVLVYPTFLFGQHIHGTIYGMEAKGGKIKLPGTTIHWEKSKTGTFSDIDGVYHLDKPANETKLIFSFLGYKSDTIEITDNISDLDVILYPDTKDLNTITITDKASKNYLQKSNPINTELITGKDLVKAACCNLSESFENSASVDVSYSDAVTGAKQIEMLGLAGIYTQILADNVPAIRGLATPYGLGYIPGTWMNSIQVSKGTSSVKNGYESISGQINVHYIESDETERLYLNMYGNSFNEGEINLLTGIKFNTNWSSSLLLHSNHSFQKMDMNHDHFLDMPLTTNFNVMNRWKYFDGRFMFHLDLKAMHEDRLGGQKHFDPLKPIDTLNGYGINIKTDRLEAITRLGLISQDKPYKSIALISTFTWHNQNSYYGLNLYDASNKTIYANLIYQSIIKTTDHKFNTGLSFIYDDYHEILNDSVMNRIESVPGIFFEYTFNYHEKFILIAGIRDDYHNLYGNFLTPRIHMKYKINDKTIIKASAGKGFRVANILAENTALLITSKKLVFQENLKPEEAWNFGIFLNRDFMIGKVKYTFNIDFYRTNFINQVIIDLDQDRTNVYFYNLNGKSYSNSMQTELNFKPFKGMEILMAYRINDVKATYDGELKARPLMKKSKAMLNLSYSTKYEKWQFDYTLQRNGKSRMPIINQTELQKFSPDFYIMNVQVTKRFKDFHIYIGVENLTNYTQKSPIISADKPFSKDFDASEIWGPVIGRKIYGGIRWVIK